MRPGQEVTSQSDTRLEKAAVATAAEGCSAQFGFRINLLPSKSRCISFLFKYHVTLKMDTEIAGHRHTGTPLPPAHHQTKSAHTK